MNSQGKLSDQPASTSEEQEANFEEQDGTHEDPRPTDLRAQSMPAATLTSMPPRMREQALPEKDDDRFFDRWAIDKARDLGTRAVRRRMVDKLRDAVSAFAEWRSLRHEPAAERATEGDRALVASTEATIKKAEAEAKQLEKEADAAEEKVKEAEADVEEVAKQRGSIRPALRGSLSDLNLMLLANLIVLAVDVFVIHLALERIPGNDREFWLTAVTMGAGAVVIGDALGWIAAAGSVRKDGSLGRPSRPAILAVAGLTILSIFFFVELADFREEAFKGIEKREGLELGDPTFFMLAQILFLLGAASVCFAYVARRPGRELEALEKETEERRDRHRGAARVLYGRAEKARQVAAEAPENRAKAKERIKSKERIAKQEAALDRKQGEYLRSLIYAEYARERADVESGARYWQFGAREESSSPSMALRWGVVAAISLLGGVGTWFLLKNEIGAAAVGLVFAITCGALLFWDRGNGDRAGWRKLLQRYVASMRQPDRERVSEIDELVPVPSPVVAPHADENGDSVKNAKFQDLLAEVKKKNEREQNPRQRARDDV
jgi:hypothetical protein